MYDFRRCILCGEHAAKPEYKLKQMLLYVCSRCDFHYIDALDDFPDEQPEGSLLKGTGAVPHGIEPQQIFRDFVLEKFHLTLRRELIDDSYWQDGYTDYFDVVTLWDTLEHVNFPVETLNAAFRGIKPGGYLFLDTPSPDSFFYRASLWSYRLSQGSKPLLLNTLYSPQPYRHKQTFTSAQLTALWPTMKQASWRNKKSKPVIGAALC